MGRGSLLDHIDDPPSFIPELLGKIYYSISVGVYMDEIYERLSFESKKMFISYIKALFKEGISQQSVQLLKDSMKNSLLQTGRKLAGFNL